MDKDTRSFSTKTLSNGLRIHFRPADVSWIFVGLGINVGHRHDPVGKEGLTHVMEHALSELDGDPVSREHKLFTMGIKGLGAFTSTERMTFLFQGIRESAPKILDRLESIIRADDLGRDLAKHLRIVRQERVATGSSDLAVFDELHQRVYQAHRLATTTGLPSDEILDSLTSAELVSHYNAHIRAGNLHVVCYGSKADELSHLAAERFSDVRAGDVPELEPLTTGSPILGGMSTFNLPVNGKKRFGWTFDLCARFPKLTGVELSVIRNALWALLTTELREKRHLTYGFKLPDSRMSDHALLYMFTRVDIEQKDAVLAELRRLFSMGLDDVALWENARQEVIIRRLLDAPSGEELMMGAMHDSLERGNPIGGLEELDVLHSMDLSRLRELCKDVTHPARLCGVIAER